VYSDLQVKYRDPVQQPSSRFSGPPQTLQTELAKEATELQSQVTSTEAPNTDCP